MKSLSSRWRGRSFWLPAFGHQGGFLTLLSSQFAGEISSWEKDTAGRIVSLLVSFGSVNYNLINVYAPMNHLERSLFYQSVHQYFSAILGLFLEVTLIAMIVS